MKPLLVLGCVEPSLTQRGGPWSFAPFPYRDKSLHYPLLGEDPSSFTARCQEDFRYAPTPLIDPRIRFVAPGPCPAEREESAPYPRRMPAFRAVRKGVDQRLFPRFYLPSPWLARSKWVAQGGRPRPPPPEEDGEIWGFHRFALRGWVRLRFFMRPQKRRKILKRGKKKAYNATCVHGPLAQLVRAGDL